MFVFHCIVTIGHAVKSVGVPVRAAQALKRSALNVLIVTFLVI